MDKQTTLCTQSQQQFPNVHQLNSTPWFVVEDGKDAGKVKVPTLAFINFLAELGFCYALVNGIYQIVRIVNNIVYSVKDNAEIIEVAKLWLLHNSRDHKIAGVFVDQILTAWINKTPQLFSKLNLKFLPVISIEPHFDTISECYLYFTNTAVKITKTDYELVSYQNLNGYVFEQQIIKRNFNPKQINKAFRTTNAAKFIYNIAGQNIDRVKAFISVVGYMLHRFKKASIAKAVILLDQSINELNAAHGGTGKSLFIRLLSQFRDVCEIPGKDFNSKGQFTFQRATSFTNIISINDVKSNFDFESQYGRVTNNFTINKKFKQEIELAFDRSPKMIIASIPVPL